MHYNNNNVVSLFLPYSDAEDCLNGTLFIQQRGFETDAMWLWYDQIALAAITLACLTLTYVGLRCIKKQK